MFEREIKFIYDFNLNKISHLGPYFTFEQLAATEIHPAILHYISAEIDYLVFEDRQKLLKNSMFDYSGERISYHFTRITEELKKTKRFAVEYIAKLILHASSFTINYLIRPKWTLARFVFDEEKHKTSNEIKQILNYVYYYKYLTKILISYINTKKILSMNVEEFESLLNKADSIGVENYLQAILSDSLKSMSEFFNIGEIKKERIPLPAVELLLEEKNLPNHLKALKEAFGSDENARFNLIDYQKVVSHVMIEKEEVSSAVEEKEEIETEEIEALDSVEKSDENATVWPDSLDKYLDDEKDEETLLEQTFIENEEVEVEKPDEAVVNRQEEPEDAELNNRGIDETEILKDIEEYEPENEMGIEKEEHEETITWVPKNILYDRSDEESTSIHLETNDVDFEEPEPTETTEEISSEPEEDVVIKTPKKFRIHMKGDGKIEPIYDEDDSREEKKMDLFKELSLFDVDASTENKPDEESNSTKYFDKEELAENGSEEDANLSGDKDDEIIAAREEENEEYKNDEIDPFVRKHDEKGEDAFDFKTMLGKQQSFYSGDEDSIDDTDEKLELDNFESGAAKKLDEKISLEETGDETESMLETIRLNALKSEEETQKVDLSELLDRKEMAKIIEVIFDYDIEDFAEVLDEISKCRNVNDAHQIINDALMAKHIKQNSKEAETFKTIITQYFEKE